MTSPAVNDMISRGVMRQHKATGVKRDKCQLLTLLEPDRPKLAGVSGYPLQPEA